MTDQDFIESVFNGKAFDFKKVAKGVQFSIQHPTRVERAHLEKLLTKYEDVTMHNDGSLQMTLVAMREVDTALAEKNAQMYQEKSKKMSSDSGEEDVDLHVALGIYNMMLHLPCEDENNATYYELASIDGNEVPVFITPNERVSVHDLRKLCNLLHTPQTAFRFEVVIRMNEAKTEPKSDSVKKYKPQMCVVGYFTRKRSAPRDAPSPAAAPGRKRMKM